MERQQIFDNVVLPTLLTICQGKNTNSIAHRRVNTNIIMAINDLVNLIALAPDTVVDVDMLVDNAENM